MPRTTFSRRALLKALATLPVTAGLARTLRADEQNATPPKRLVIFMQNNGTQQANFWPTDASLSSPILDALFLDESGNDNGLRAKTNLIKGVYVPNDANGTTGNQHDMGFARMFTGARLLSQGGQPWGGATSVDQLVANAWGIDSLTLAVLASQTEPHPKPGFDHRESFCYFGPGTIKHPRTDPISVFNDLFPGPDPNRSRHLNVLDAVAGNLAEVEGRLGTTERAKLDIHLSAINDVRNRLRSPPVVCANQPNAPPDYLAIDRYAETTEDTYIPQLMENMIDLAAVSLICGITRIATVQMGYGGGKWRFGWKDIGVNCHDNVAHLDTSDAGSSAQNTSRLVRMNRYYASCVARLATQLNAVPDGNGTLLDNTLVVWANEQGRGDHNQENVPIVLVGGAGGAISQGSRLIDQGRQVFNRLGCTVLNVMGLPCDGFGDVAECGTFQGLL
jgi:hypothetical protein